MGGRNSDGGLFAGGRQCRLSTAGRKPAARCYFPHRAASTGHCLIPGLTWRLALSSRIAGNPCVCQPIRFPDTDVNTVETQSGANLRPIVYWRLWLLDAALAGAGVLFFFATRYGTGEFMGRALAMALLPFIAVMILVGGAGSTLFALTKVMIEKRSLKVFPSLIFLVGPALALAALLGWLGVWRSPEHRLAHVCLGNAPPTASRIHVAGYSTFLREEWLAVFHVGPKDFQTMVARSKLEPAYTYEFRNALAHSPLKQTRLYRSLPPLNEAPCFARIFDAGKEHQRGSVYAMFDPATSLAIVVRECQD